MIDPTGLINAPVWYLDVDGDGYGNNIDILTSCVQPEDYVSNNQIVTTPMTRFMRRRMIRIAMGYPQIWTVMMVFKISVIV